MVYASGAADQMRTLIKKSFKVTLGLSLLPLAFLAAFGTTVIIAWTGQADPSFRITLWLVCAAGLFQSFSILSLVLYRVSGKALLDNIRQVLRIVTLLSIALFAKSLGFYGVLAGLAAAEFVGMVFMIFAIKQTFLTFQLKSLLYDSLKFTAAALLFIVAGLVVNRYVPSPVVSNTRLFALMQLIKVGISCLLAVWPALMITRAVTGAEWRALLSAFSSRRLQPKRSAQV